MDWRVKSLDAIVQAAGAKPLRRSLGPWRLVMLGIGGVIGTGIFALTAVAAQKAGPGMLASFAIAGLVCAAAALCYAELAAMAPVAGSAYTYSYAVMGELVAWLVGWSIILEYGLGASAVAVTWSGHVSALLDSIGLHIPHALTVGPKIKLGFIEGGETGGLFNLPAVAITALVTLLLVIGTREGANVTAVLVTIKIAALALFLCLTLPLVAGHVGRFHPLAPRGWGDPLDSDGAGILGAAASIFFAYVGFDAVATSAEETENPQRNVPIGLLGSLGVCTVVYILVAIGAIAASGAQPLFDPATGKAFADGSGGLYASAPCASLHAPMVCSKEALAYVLQQAGRPLAGRLVALAATVALPSVVLTMMFGQARVFFVMARDGLLPRAFSAVHPRFQTPWVITLGTGAIVGMAAAIFPVGQLADYSNAGTLFAFAAVSIGVIILRRRDKTRARPFRVPMLFLVAPVSICGCVVLFMSLGPQSKGLFGVWTLLGLFAYLGYGRRHSNFGRALD